jgi:RHH-type proline utilization regulon transcriptional repressor/proline dehydrogenase/delta 1-pyrroline-5-carboxylate dehydrogenase
VGTHETLLAYLVRRLLENGANTSFVNRIADPALAGRLVQTRWQPVLQAAQTEGTCRPAPPAHSAASGAVWRGAQQLAGWIWRTSTR